MKRFVQIRVLQSINYKQIRLLQSINTSRYRTEYQLYADSIVEEHNLIAAEHQLEASRQYIGFCYLACLSFV